VASSVSADFAGQENRMKKYCFYLQIFSFTAKINTKGRKRKSDFILSWIKRLFQRFNQEEDNSIDESINTNHKSTINKGSPNEIYKDIETRVIYQYPKGNFRFPLIPDEINDKKDDRRVRHRPSEQEVKNTEKERYTRPNKETAFEASDRKKKKEVPKKKISSGRPFRPTEIPSPIFGYDRRPKNTEPIEFELKDFAELSSKRSTKNEGHIKEIEPKTVLSTDEDLNFPEAKLQGELHHFEERPQEEALGFEEELQHEEPLGFEKEPQHKEPLGFEEEPQHEEPLGFEEELQHEKPLGFEKEPRHEEPRGFEEEPQHEESLGTEEESRHEEPSNFDEETYRQEDGEIEQPLPEEPSVKMEGTIPSVLSTPKSNLSEGDENEVQEEKKRSHLPFNVIMLREDRNRLRGKDHSISNIQDIHRKSTRLRAEETKSKEEEVDAAEGLDGEPYYVYPPLTLLKPPLIQNVNQAWMEEQEHILNETLVNFNVRAKVVNVTQGPSVTRYEVQPEPGVKVNKITNLSDDIKLSLAARDIRMEAPIPGKHTIGIEVPNKTSRPVLISEIINSQTFHRSDSPLLVALGLDISGKPIVTDLSKMPHGLIAGATGSGKSVCINSILVSLLYKANPNEVKLLLIDPKMVELAPYNQIPHLVTPVITDVKAATAALKWAVDEMERRYELFAHTGVRDISRFNETAENDKRYSDKLPYIVIVIDELADLMMMSPADVEEAICRIAQKARACGIHLIIATQRPSVDVITGLIKANVPTRIAFSVSSQVDSRTIIDIGGAEKLLGKGDMLFLENGSSKPVRLQGTFVSDEEIEQVVSHVRREQLPVYLFEQEELLKKTPLGEEEDELFYEACEFIIDQGGASTSSLQRKFKIGYNRAARLIDLMEEQGFISEAKGSKPRDVLITESELESIQDVSN
jgi:S-DNA-T family DNA segregation ATPase FtsK/SpoIIIE